MPEEKKARPKIEDVIGNFLSDDALKNGLDFIAYLKENKMSPQWSAANSWKVSYRAQNILFIRLGSESQYYGMEKGSWYIYVYIGGYEDSLPDDFKEIVWSNIKYCNSCSHCKGERMMIFGKEFDNVCDSFIVNNPDSRAIECVKKIMPMRRKAIERGQTKKYFYIPKKNRR